MIRSVFFAVLVVVSEFPAPACDCGSPGPACAYVSRAAAVFIGTVAFSDHDPALGLRQRTFVRFKVEESFKGLSQAVSEVWVDPGSFTSCYAEYNVGERLLVFAYGGGRSMPPDTAMMSVVPGQLKSKALPAGINQDNPPIVYSAPECSGTRDARADDPGLKADIEYLRQYRSGVATRSVRGRVTEDEHFGIFGQDPVPGLDGVTLTLSGNGLTRSVRTDANGFYSFDDIPIGAYEVSASRKPYVSQWHVRDVEVPRAGCAAANFDMIAPGMIRGTLLDANGRPASKVRVEILRLNEQGKPIYYGAKQATTSIDGSYQFSELPQGPFQIGVNLFRPPDVKTPFRPTNWSEGNQLAIFLKPGEQKLIRPFRLPKPAAVRRIEAKVQWTDGRPASGVTVWGEVGDQAAASDETDENGLASLDLLEGVTYNIEGKIWIVTDTSREVARSGPLSVTPESTPLHLTLIMSKRSHYYR